MTAADVKPWQWLALAAIGLLTTLSAGYFGRDYQAKKEVHQLQEQVTRSSMAAETNTAKALYLDNLRQELTEQVASLRKAAKNWDKGHRQTLVDGSVIEDWDRGSATEEESLNKISRELTEMTKQLETSQTQTKLAQSKADSLQVQLLTKTEELKRVGFHGAVLAGWDLSGGLPMERAHIQAIGALGPLLMGLSLAPAGPWARPGNLDSAAAVAGALRPAVWAGLKL